MPGTLRADHRVERSADGDAARRRWPRFTPTSKPSFRALTISRHLINARLDLVWIRKLVTAPPRSITNRRRPARRRRRHRRVAKTAEMTRCRPPRPARYQVKAPTLTATRPFASPHPHPRIAPRTSAKAPPPYVKRLAPLAGSQQRHASITPPARQRSCCRLQRPVVDFFPAVPMCNRRDQHIDSV